MLLRRVAAVPMAELTVRTATVALPVAFPPAAPPAAPRLARCEKPTAKEAASCAADSTGLETAGSSTHSVRREPAVVSSERVATRFQVPVALSMRGVRGMAARPDLTAPDLAPDRTATAAARPAVSAPAATPLTAPSPPAAPAASPAAAPAPSPAAVPSSLATAAPGAGLALDTTPAQPGTGASTDPGSWTRSRTARAYGRRAGTAAADRCAADTDRPDTDRPDTDRPGPDTARSGTARPDTEAAGTVQAQAAQIRLRLAEARPAPADQDRAGTNPGRLDRQAAAPRNWDRRTPARPSQIRVRQRRGHRI
jgi:translation initiation factor IF-2